MKNIDFRQNETPEHILEVIPSTDVLWSGQAGGNCHKNGRKPVSLGFNLNSSGTLVCANTISVFIHCKILMLALSYT